MLTPREVARAAAFTAGLVAVLGGLRGGLGYGARHVRRGDAGKISRVMGHAADPELAIFGASNAESGISPALLERATGRTAENLAVDGTGVAQYGALVRELLRYGRPGAHVILVMSPFALAAPALPTAPSWYYPHIGNPFVYEAMARFDATTAWRARHVPFYDFVVYDHTYYRNAVEGLRAAFGAPLDDPDRGFTPRGLRWDERLDAAGQRPFPCVIEAETVAVYRSLLAAIEASGRKAFVVFPPVQADAIRLLPGMEELVGIFASFAPGDHYLDYHRDPMGTERRYFYNHTHLNVEGAERFSTMLGSDLDRVLRSEAP